MRRCPYQSGRRLAEDDAAGTSRTERDEGATACAIGGSSGRTGSSKRVSAGVAGVGGSRARSNPSSLMPTRSAWGGWDTGSTRRPRRVDAHTPPHSARWLLRVRVRAVVGGTLPPPSATATVVRVGTSRGARPVRDTDSRVCRARVGGVQEPQRQRPVQLWRRGVQARQRLKLQQTRQRKTTQQGGANLLITTTAGGRARAGLSLTDK